jgi:hypothetical protein
MSRVVSIELTEVPRFNAKPRSLTPREQKAFDKWFTEALQKKWVRPSQARHSSGLIWVPKKNGELRPCIDYRQLNAITKKRVYAPLADTTLRQAISRSRWYTKIDLKNAFYHMFIETSDTWKTAFRTPKGLYEFVVLPFGLQNAPGEFQLYIERVLNELLGDHVTVHIDDILIHAETREECASMSHRVVARLKDAQIEINREKSTYLTQSVDYCSYRYGYGTIQPIYRTETIDDWPMPRGKRDLQSILGFANHYREHIPNYASLAQPLYALTGNSDWDWKPRHSECVARIKKALHNMVMTHSHDRMQPCTITTDASLFAIGAIMTQKGHVTAIISRSLTKEEKNYDASERELLAVVYALDKWIWLVEEAPRILVRTDNMINTGLLTPSESNRRRNRWIERLGRHVITWKHIPGKDNPADYPSRRPDYK